MRDYLPYIALVLVLAYIIIGLIYDVVISARIEKEIERRKLKDIDSEAIVLCLLLYFLFWPIGPILDFMPRIKKNDEKRQ